MSKERLHRPALPLCALAGCAGVIFCRLKAEAGRWSVLWEPSEAPGAESNPVEVKKPCRTKRCFTTEGRLRGSA
jgi:hypothetical protein